MSYQHTHDYCLACQDMERIAVLSVDRVAQLERELASERRAHEETRAACAVLQDAVHKICQTIFGEVHE